MFIIVLVVMTAVFGTLIVHHEGMVYVVHAARQIAIFASHVFHDDVTVKFLWKLIGVKVEAFRCGILIDIVISHELT